MIEIQLLPGEHVLVGYGSLLSVSSMEQTLGRRYDGPWQICQLNGWRRGWDVQMPRHSWRYRESGKIVTPDRVLYLNLRRQAGSHVNAALFVIHADELQRFDEREWIYGRQQVNDDLLGVRVRDGVAWTYVALEEYLWRKASHPPETVVRRSYLSILKRAHEELGAEFRREYEATTDFVPADLVVDDFQDT